MAKPVVHEYVRCPRCAARGMRELTSLPEEGHPIFMCPFCRHTWCERGRRGMSHGALLHFGDTRSPTFSMGMREDVR